ncbi:hypothetical protein BC936DRAFT_140499 [Jimgerdemannia flammicorona]|uniref:Uncharacterized protein n=1 Tax=Jimgerdemannia flammicorona TaxID=994334 RepID=A0A433AT95_9FUNG|nr:hypothetical protein BC936DRAFT_140499 [Jimgerdemannia flammicorona]
MPHSTAHQHRRSFSIPPSNGPLAPFPHKTGKTPPSPTMGSFPMLAPFPHRSGHHKTPPSPTMGSFPLAPSAHRSGHYKTPPSPTTERSFTFPPVTPVAPFPHKSGHQRTPPSPTAASFSFPPSGGFASAARPAHPLTVVQTFDLLNTVDQLTKECEEVKARREVARVSLEVGSALKEELRKKDAKISEKNRDCERKWRTLAKLETQLRAQKEAERKKKEAKVVATEVIQCSRPKKGESTVTRIVQSMVGTWDG